MSKEQVYYSNNSMETSYLSLEIGLRNRRYLGKRRGQTATFLHICKTCQLCCLLSIMPLVNEVTSLGPLQYFNIKLTAITSKVIKF